VGQALESGGALFGVWYFKGCGLSTCLPPTSSTSVSPCRTSLALRTPGATPYGFQGADFAFTNGQPAFFQQLPQSFELLTKQLLTLAIFCAMVFTVAQKGAPPFVRYLSIFPLHFGLRERRLPRSGRGALRALCVNSGFFF